MKDSQSLLQLFS